MCAAVAAALLTLAAAHAANPVEASEFARTQFASPRKAISNFELVNQDGQRFGLRQLEGRPTLLFFGFTHCQDVCPATLQVLRIAHRDLSALKPAPLVVLVSVDGDRDTPANMKEYLAPYGDGFIGLTGSPKSVRDIAAQFSAVFFKGAPADNSGNYQVEHTSQVYLIDRAGKVTATFYRAPADEIVAAVRREVAGGAPN